MKVPFVDLPKQLAPLHDEILSCWKEILNTGRFIGGPYVESFEKEFARKCSVSDAVSVASGTDALLYILLALGVRAGDEIIVPVNTFIATAEAVSQCGAIPVFVDIEPVYYNIDPSTLEKVITPKTKGIIAVHLYGHPAEMDELASIAEKNNLWIVEDACQAHLAEYKSRKAGSLARAGAFSFYPGKNLGACGEGGAVTTNDKKLANTIRKLRDHGQQRKYYHEIVGYNGRCDALQAAALLVKLKHLDEWNDQRRIIASNYNKMLSEIDLVLPRIADHVKSVFHLYVILIEKRDIVSKLLAERGVATAMHYPVPLHLQPAYLELGYGKGDFPVAEYCAERLLSLPMFAELTFEQQQFVCDNLLDIVTNDND